MHQPNHEAVPLWTVFLFLLVIAGGIYLRFTDLTAEAPNEDEIYSYVSAVKLNIDHPKYDPRYYNFEHPYLGKKILGLLIDKTQNYYNTSIIPINLFVYNYLASIEIRDQVDNMKWMAALFGLLLLIPLFLIGKKLFNSETAWWGAALAAVSIGFINLSRLATQDVILPFFMWMALYFAIEYYESKPTDKIWKLPSNKIFLAATWIFLLISFLIRIGQPLIFLLGILVAFRDQKAKLIALSAGLPAIAGVIYWQYTPYAIENMLIVQKYTSAISYNTNFFVGIITQNSLTVVGIITTAILFRATQAAQNRNAIVFSPKNISQRWNGLSNVYQASIITIVLTTLLVFFTPAGETPRIYLVFVGPLLIVIAKIAQTSRPFAKKIFFGLLIVDLILLAGTAPLFREYSPVGIPPIFAKDETPEFFFIQQKVASIGVKNYFTNDARLLLYDKKAVPLPPFHKAYTYANACTENFTNDFNRGIIVYQNRIAISQNKYLCPWMTAWSAIAPYFDGKTVYRFEEHDIYVITPR